MADLVPKLVPKKFRDHPQYPRVIQGLRIIQFILAVVNTGLFASYIVRTSIRLSHSSGAVVGVLSAAIAFSIIATIVSCTKLGKSGWTTAVIWTVDILFLGAFIAVSVLTSLDRNQAAGPGGNCGNHDEDNDNNGMFFRRDNDHDHTQNHCGLTSASMGLAITSSIMHALSSVLGGGQNGKPTSSAGKLENPLQPLED